MAAASEQDALKRRAAEAAVAEIEEGMVVGLGTGSTAAHAIDALAARVAQGLRILAIPTSERSAAQATQCGIALTDFADHPTIDLTIDGADQVSPALDLIKGMGGALLREKIVAAASRRLVIIVDASKLAPNLALPLPVEVNPFGWQATAAHIARLGGKPVLRGGGQPFRTDGGHFILDCDFGPIVDPAGLERALSVIVGVVESGLFVGRATEVVVAEPGGVRRLTRP